MNKQSLFNACMQAGLYMDIDWLVSAFSITKPRQVNPSLGEGVSKKPFEIISNMTGYFYLDKDLVEVKIEDAQMGVPLFNLYEKITVSPGDAPNIKTAVETDYGNLLFNWIALVHSFGDLFDFVPSNLEVKDILKKIAPLFRDEPDDPSKKEKGYVYVSDYLMFSRCVFTILPNLSQLVTLSFTEKYTLPADGIEQEKKRLFKQYEGQLEDPIVVAEIQKQLKAFDDNYTKGDPGGRFAFDKKAKTARVKTSLMFGVEPHPSGDPSKVLLIKSSLSEGLELENMPAMMNSLRMGSYARGAETQFGGVVYKDLVRALSGLSIDDGYCGTKLGIPIEMKEKELSAIVGSSVMGGVPKLVTSKEEARAYLGKTILVSSPQYCASAPYKYCRCCAGEVLWDVRQSITQAGTAVGQGFLGLFMSKMHGKAFEVAEFSVDEDFS